MLALAWCELNRVVHAQCTHKYGVREATIEKVSSNISTTLMQGTRVYVYKY